VTTTATPTAPAAAGGILDRGKTEAVVKSHLSEVNRCYKWGRTDDTQTNGRVMLKISVSVTGAVTAAKVDSSSFRSTAVGSCIVEAARSWKFPAPVGGPAVAYYPFDFH
jgi:TonB family protein